MRASTSVWASADSFGAFEGCCVGSGAATDTGLKRFDGTSEAAADAKAARRANSRREIAELLLLPIAKSPCLDEEVQKYEWRPRMRLLNLHSSVNYHRNVTGRLEKRAGRFSRK